MIRLLIVDDTRIHREGLAQELARRADICVVGAAGPDEAVALADDARPDVVLLRAAMPDGEETLRAIAGASMSVVVVGVRDGDAMRWLEAGAAGIVTLDDGLDDLLATIESAMRGEVHCSPRLAGTLVRRVAFLAAAGRREPTTVALSPREREIVRLIDQGLSNKEIAARLYIEVRTVKNHVHNILQKLQVHRRGEAAAWLRDARPSGHGSTGELRDLGHQPRDR